MLQVGTPPPFIENPPAIWRPADRERERGPEVKQILGPTKSYTGTYRRVPCPTVEKYIFRKPVPKRSWGRVVPIRV